MMPPFWIGELENTILPGVQNPATKELARLPTFGVLSAGGQMTVPHSLVPDLMKHSPPTHHHLSTSELIFEIKIKYLPN